MGQIIFLAQVTWRDKDRVGGITPGKFPVRVVFNRDENRYEASIPAYHREEGMPFQLAVRSPQHCAILAAGGPCEMASFNDPDTGETWWLEKGSWEPKGKYHDAPSYRHPGGYVDLAVGEESFRIFVYNPSLTEEEFLTILEDLKGWCWRMAVDESCYVMLENDSELKVLSDRFKQLVSDFNRHTAELLKLPHRELRESVAYQSLDRLRPNMESLRFLAQRGERRAVPGRGASPHFATVENSLVLGMLNTVTAMLRPQLFLAGSKVQRFRSTAQQYGKRAAELQQDSTVAIDPRVLDENIRRSYDAYSKIREMQNKGYRAVRIPTEKGYNDGWYKSSNPFYIVDISGSPKRLEIERFVSSRGPATVVGNIQASTEMSVSGNRYTKYRVGEVVEIFLGRDFQKECQALQNARNDLEKSGWRATLGAEVLRDRRREAQILGAREIRLTDAAERSAEDRDTVAALLRTAESSCRTMRSLGVTPRHDVVPSIVFLQSPHYSGALSSFRGIKELFGLEQEAVDNLLSLEAAGVRDWPAIFERWCLISLLRVLEDDLRFSFDKSAVTRNLLAYCAGKKVCSFTLPAVRHDMNLSLALHYQYRMANGREPDFLLVLNDDNKGISIQAVFDAKSCRFIQRPDDADKHNVLLYVDDSVEELLHKKDYGEGGKNRVFVLHSSLECIAHPTTVQPWAAGTSCGGDAVFHWDSSAKSMPRHGYGAVMLRPHDLSHLKLIILRLIQLGLGRKDICASCGAGGGDITVTEDKTEGQKVKFLCTCSKCSFVTRRTHCVSCGAALYKNQGYWTYHDLHPTKIWNSKCWACGTLL